MQIERRDPQSINKAIYNNNDERKNLDTFESVESDKSFVNTVKTQAKSVACLISNRFLEQKDGGGWELTSQTPTLAQVVQNEFLQVYGTDEVFGEQEAFCDESAAGFGTAFLVDKQRVMTAAHCLCKKDTNILDEKVIATTYIVFNFQNGKKLFAGKQVYQIKKVISHQYIRIKDKHQNFTEWTDWALVELDREVSYTPLKMNMTKKIADKVELYMLGHPYGLPVKFVSNGFVLRNKQTDFFETNLDAFGGNSGSPVFNKLTCEVEGMLCNGKEDYAITDNYRQMQKRRIEARHITSNRDGFEICQRMTVLRFLIGNSLLGTHEIDQGQNTSYFIIHSLKECYKSRNTIPRLLHSALPINEIYTELVLLNKSNEEDKKKEKKTFEEHRINSWEDIHASKEPIELQNLFKNQKRLLVLGRAGIGKSTLCQYISHQWAEGKLWNEKFDALFWVPLRKLQHAHTTETVFSFLFRHCCQEKSENLYPNDIAIYLQQNANRILFVLDGLDEVALEENSLQKGIVDQLLKFPHWILSSRPHAAGSIHADQTIENVGFASKTIDLYIQKSFPKNTQEIIQKIRQNPIIFGLCHIPINLELVCSILKKSKGDISSINSMTSLYEELTLTLQRRFLEKIGRENAWDYEQGDLENDSQVSEIFSVLESIAWTGMQQRQLLFSFKLGKTKEIYHRYPPSEKRTDLFTQACTMSGFLQSTGESDQFLQNEYSFLHLTFQEFFAARYLVKLLENNSVEAVKCIREVKFDPRYKVVIWFIAGLLKNHDDDFKTLNTFFEILDSPKDQVGLYGILLKIRCLEECGWQMALQKIKIYEEEIGIWLEKLKVNEDFSKTLIETFQICPRGSKQLFIPKLKSYLSNDDKFAKAIAISALGQVGLADPEAIIPALLETLEHKNSGIRLFSAIALVQLNQAHHKAVIFPLLEVLKENIDDELPLQAFDQIGQTNPQAVIPALIELLSGWGREATKALGFVGRGAPEAVIPALLEALKNKDWGTRCFAIESLSKLKPTPALDFIFGLFNAFSDENNHVRNAAVKALAGIDQEELTYPIRALLEVLKDEEDKLKITALEALGYVGHIDLDNVIPTLFESLNDENKDIRTATIGALSQIGQTNPKTVIPVLLEAFKDKNDWISKTALEALGHVAHAEPNIIIPLLVETLSHKRSYFRESASKALGYAGQSDPKTVIPELVKALYDENKEVRSAAVKALAQLGPLYPEAVIPILIEAIKNNDTHEKIAAIKALGKIGHTNPEAVFPPLLNALNDKNRWVKTAAVQALDLLGHSPNIVIPALLEALKDEDDDDSDEVNTFEYRWMQFYNPEKVKDMAATALNKYDLSPYLNSHPYIVNPTDDWKTLLTSTPLTSIITFYKKDPFPSSIYSAAIAKKCLEESLALFQIDNTLCYFEQGKLCTINLLNATEFITQIEHRVLEYPEFILNPIHEPISPSPQTQVNNADKIEIHIIPDYSNLTTTSPQTQNQQNPKSNATKSKKCSIQ